MPNYSKELVTITCELKHETAKAWLIIDGDNEVWVPKSIGEWNPKSKDGVVGEMDVPTWFAEKEGLT